MVQDHRYPACKVITASVPDVTGASIIMLSRPAHPAGSIGCPWGKAICCLAAGSVEG